jgi:hypothetical protein
MLIGRDVSSLSTDKRTLDVAFEREDITNQLGYSND